MSKTRKRPSRAAQQATYRDRLATQGQVQVTVNISNKSAQLMRSLAVTHGQTQGRVVEAGILAAAKRLVELGNIHVEAHGGSPALTRPVVALADLESQLDEIEHSYDLEGDEPPLMRASEARAIALNLVGLEMRA
ncbi:hypothetical protein [Methylobacterium soli]|uniref:Uncharacterized protein n=1 Tax=Methylobacterium soli TaxID=553447 RepID=A0A6L3SX56_9HYPH|nr:hypothetical protein [Methylobacterium soli]KAB1078371.1 hypothetical protein F6X53_14880 [Methylobacterium soli]